MTQKYYIGVMSGTSLDGIDIAICHIDSSDIRVVAYREYPIPKKLQIDILNLIKKRKHIKFLGEIDHRLGNLFAKSIKNILKSNQIKAKEIYAIGLHGQTIWHQPNSSRAFTMQIGDPNIVAIKTQIAVVADFRRKDIALGGQGAPFAPAFHQFLYKKSPKSTAILNIGGMANITILGDNLIGYDTGCGNVLLDTWIHLHRNLSFDRDGEWARSGKIDKKLLKTMLGDRYFSMPHPKSTGREKFNQKWIERYLSDREYHPKDIQRTLLELTAITISAEIDKFDIDKLFVCGGGAKNGFLLERIDDLLPKTKVQISHNADMIEAMTFAWLAYKRLKRQKVKLKSVTGAIKNTILGGLYE